MSWQDLIKQPLIITTPDGRDYTPLWKNAKKNGAFNAKKYDFVNLQGTFVFRGKKPGDGYPLEIFFTGDDCIQTANDFEISFADERPLNIQHPYYSNKRVQLLSFERDDSKLNVSRFVLQVFETIESNQPTASGITKDDINDAVNGTSEDLINGYANNINPDSSDVKNATNGTGICDDNFSKVIKVTKQFSDFKRTVNKAYTAADNIITDTEIGIRSVNNLLMFPATTATNMLSRIDRFGNTLGQFKDTLSGIKELNSLKFFTAYGGMIVNAAILSSINNNDGDYTTRSSIVNVISKLEDIFNSYITFIDDNTASDPRVKGRFSPNAKMIESLFATLKLAQSKLIGLIQGAKIERTFVVDYDTNIIILAHRLYGLQPDDSTIDKLINMNNIQGNNFFAIKKNTKIKYVR